MSVKRRILVVPALLLLAHLYGCSAVTLRQLAAEGKQPLTREQLAALLPDASLRLAAIDYDGILQFRPDGQLAVKDRLGQAEKGTWEITGDNQLCLKFGRRHYGDSRCYSIVKDNNSYIFFTANGARSYTGTLNSPPPAGKTADVSRPPKPGVPEQQSGGGIDQAGPVAKTENGKGGPPGFSEEEKTHTLVQLARNCPECNLYGIDLKNAALGGANLAKANLAGADLSGTNLSRANLSGANLAGARLINTDLSGADLSGSNLAGADLTGSNLTRANVSNAQMAGANLNGAILHNIQGLK
jgi:hypothetical protein